MNSKDQDKARKLFKASVDARICYKKFEIALSNVFKLDASAYYELVKEFNNEKQRNDEDAE